MRKGYNVYKNGQFIRFIDGRSKADMNRFIDDFPIGTHMCEWSRKLIPAPGKAKPVYEYEYATTVGIYLTFKPTELE